MATAMFSNLLSLSRRDSAEDKAQAMEQSVHRGQRVLLFLRLRFAGFLLLLAVGSALAWDWYEAKRFRADHHVCSSLACAFLTEIFFVIRLLLPCFAPLADDVCLTRCVLIVDAVLFTRTRYRYMLKSMAEWASLDWRSRFQRSSFVGRGVAFVSYAAWGLTATKPSTIQGRMWGCVISYLVLNMLEQCVHVVVFRTFHAEMGQVAIDAVFLAFILQPEVRVGAQNVLRRRLWAWGATEAAAKSASIACLIGGESAARAISRARSNFRAVHLDKMAFQDFEDNAPNPELIRFTEHTRIGKCDAFLSHSWHDDPTAKWIALQSWRHAFVAQHQREPSVWFDKYCIDQNNIEVDLRCLPLYLSGCNRLVILCGASYLCRLWCILELFAYTHMGGKQEDIDILLVSGSGEDREAVLHSFESFDARRCECSSPGDKQKILQIIRTAFVTIDDFNRVVKQITRSLGRHIEGYTSPSWEESSGSASDASSDSGSQEEGEGTDDN